MKFRRCVDAFLLVRESSGECFFLVGFLGQKVLSGGLGRVTPAVGFGGERSLPSRYIGRACAESREVTLAHIRVDITLSVLPVFRWNLSGCATCKAQNGCSDGMLVESSHSDRQSQLCCVGRGNRGQHSPHNDQYNNVALM